MKDFFRAEDIIGRLGGEEFGLAMLFDKADDVVMTLNRFRQKLAEQFSKVKPPVEGIAIQPFTISIGVCIVDSEQDVELDDLLKCADNALYQVKQQGKNAVMVYQDQQ